MIGQLKILSPVQRRVLEMLLDGIAPGDVLTLHGGAGSGKTAVLNTLRYEAGGSLVRTAEIRPVVSEEGFLRTLEQALARHQVVIVDDLHIVTGLVERRHYLRTYLLDAALTTILAEATALRKTLIFGMEGTAPWPIALRARIVVELPS